MTPERFAEINDLIRNYRKSRMGKPKMWALIGELANEVGGDLHAANMRATHPIMTVPSTTERAAAQTVGERLAAVAGAQQRPEKPITPSPGQWKRMTEDERTAHFLAIRAYDVSLTLDERRAIEDADAAQEAERRANFATYKEEFEDRPFVRPN